MTKFFRSTVLAVMTATPLIFNACKKDDPTPEVNQEEFNRVVFSFTKLDASGNETTEVVTAEFDDLEHSHEAGAADEHGLAAVDLAHGSKYRMNVNLYRDQELLNQEIYDEGEAHQLFFIPSVPGIVDYQYEDKDVNNKPVGLKGTLNVVGAGEIDLNVVLRHNLNKNHSAAATWNNPNFAEAGGADDLNLTLEIHSAH